MCHEKHHHSWNNSRKSSSYSSVETRKIRVSLRSFHLHLKSLRVVDYSLKYATYYNYQHHVWLMVVFSKLPTLLLKLYSWWNVWLTLYYKYKEVAWLMKWVYNGALVSSNQQINQSIKIKFSLPYLVKEAKDPEFLTSQGQVQRQVRFFLRHQQLHLK